MAFTISNELTSRVSPQRTERELTERAVAAYSEPLLRTRWGSLSGAVTTSCCAALALVWYGVPA